MRGNFSAVARVLGKSTSTISRRYDRWIELQQTIAAAKARKTLQPSFAPDADPESSPDADQQNGDAARDADAEVPSVERNYVGAAR